MSSFTKEPIEGFLIDMGRLERILSDKNQIWAIELSEKIVNKIEKNNIPNSQRLSLYNKIINAWQNYLKTLLKDFVNNWPFIYNAFHQLFHLFVQIMDHNRITDNGVRLVQNLIKIQFATKEQIAHLLEDLAILTYKANNFRKATQLIFLAVFFRRNYNKNKYFSQCFESLESILKKLSPKQRSILLDFLLMNTFNEFFGSTFEEKSKSQTGFYDQSLDYTQFLNEIYRAIVNSVGSSFRESIQEVKKMNRQLRDKTQSLDEIKSTIFVLHLLNEYDWASLLITNYCDILRAKDNLKEMYGFLEEYTQVSFQQGAFQSSYESYCLLEDLLITKTRFQTGKEVFPTEIVKIWAEAAEMFKSLENKTFFVRSIAKYEKYINSPLQYKSYKEFQNYLFATNEYYKLIRGYISTPKWLFWTTVLHRSIFEEAFKDIAYKAIDNLPKTLRNLPVMEKLLTEDVQSTLHWKKEKKQTSKGLDIAGRKPQKITIKLRIPKNDSIKFFIKTYYGGDYSDQNIVSYSESWEEPMLNELYKKDTDFGKIGYLFLPKDLREQLLLLNIKGEQVPEVFVIQDEPSYPLEQLHNGNATLGSIFAFGYRFREPKLTPDLEELRLNSTFLPGERKFNVLSIGDLNKHYPVAWVESERKNKPLYAFPQGTEQSRYVAMKLKELSHLVGDYDSINPETGNLANIQQKVTSGKFSIIHIAANLFFVEENPRSSYFITSDNHPLSVETLNEMLSYAKKHNEIQKIEFFEPLLIFDGRIICKDKVVPKPFEMLSKICSEITFSNILGLFGRTSTTFNEEVQSFLGNFLERILMGESLGSGLLTANRHLYLIARRMLRKNPDDKHIFESYRTLTNTHYVFYGDPFVRLSDKLKSQKNPE